MKKQKIICTAILFAALFILGGCRAALGEAPGAFGNYGTPTPGSCPHSERYDRATPHDPYGRYPNAKYHYVYCENAGFDGGCDFSPHFEAHKQVFSEFYGDPQKLYNGYFYHTARYICAVFGDSAGSDYILCSDNSGKCRGNCENAVRHAGGIP